MAAFTFLFLSVFLFALLVNAADLYKVLDIDRAASEKDIRAAYKRLSRKYHPDKNKEEGAEEKFVEVAHAYEVLSDPQKRQIYDRHGEEGLKMHEGGGQHHANPFDMFQNFFGGGHPGGAQTRKGPTSLLEMEINLADMYTGASIDFSVKKRILCCNGQGVKIMRQQIFPGMFSQSQVTCNECGGRGKVIKRQCPHCQGAKVLDHTQRLTLEVPRGSPEGHEIVFEGEADENPDWEAGDILIRVKSKTVKGGFRRKESGLYWKETISVDEALLGFERNITHLDGHTVELKRNSVTQPGFVQTIKGEGMPIYEGTGYGDLYVEYNVILPNKLSPQLRKQLTDVFRGDKSGKAGKDEL